MWLERGPSLGAAALIKRIPAQLPRFTLKHCEDLLLIISNQSQVHIAAQEAVVLHRCCY